MTESTVSFGYWIRRQRKVLDPTQQALADRVACSLAAIKKIKSDERRPSRQIAERLAVVLSVPANQRKLFQKDLEWGTQNFMKNLVYYLIRLHESRQGQW